MARVSEPTRRPGMDGPGACHQGGGPLTDRVAAGRSRRRGVMGWVLLVVASLVYAAASFMLAGLVVGLVPLGAESRAQGYLHLLLAVVVTGLATGFTAGLRGLAAGVPMLGAAVLVLVVYAATGGGVDPFLAAVTAGSVGAMLGVVVADRRGAPRTERAHRSRAAPSRPRGVAWTIAAVAVPALAVLAMSLSYAMDLASFDFGVAAGVVAVLVAAGTGACVAQARRHFGREPRWGLSMFLGVVAAVIANYASYIIAATMYYSQF
jgi:hypothetical protein